MNRREFIKTGLVSAVVLPAAGALLHAGIAHAEEEVLITAMPDMAPMVTALQYVDASAKADQNCESCQLFTAGADGNGKCQLFAKGLVKSAGWCASWVKKV
jgi:hypothetical protein